jgi:phosphate transport system substrate-binding protein
VKRVPLLSVAAAGCLAFGVAACGGDDSGGGSSSTAGGDLSGSISIDGSSTVAPLTEQIAARFQADNPDVQVSVGTSGTGGGFEKFCRGETDISEASRTIEDEEIAACEKAGIAYEEIGVANDALSVVVNPGNPVECMSVEQLSAIYGPESKITNWNEVEGLEPSFEAKLAIFSPGSDSGTFDYFTEEINGEEGAQRTDGVNVVGEDDNATVTGVSGDEGGIGYFGYSFYNENRDRLKAMQVKNPDTGDCVAPSETTVQDGSYKPLSRELFIYPSAKALERPEVKAFVEYYLEHVNDVIPEAGFIGLTPEQLTEAQAKVQSLSAGGTATETTTTP